MFVPNWKIKIKISQNHIIWKSYRRSFISSQINAKSSCMQQRKNISVLASMALSELLINAFLGRPRILDSFGGWKGSITSPHSKTDPFLLIPLTSDDVSVKISSQVFLQKHISDLYIEASSCCCATYSYMSRLMGKPTICICENKGADQLRCNREADQHLCFRYSDSTFPPLLNSKISSF